MEEMPVSLRCLLPVLPLLLFGCASTGNVPSSGVSFSLDGCTPFLNCVSSESTLGLYQVEPVKLSAPLGTEAWESIKNATLKMPGASLNDSRFGYLDVTFYSDLLNFPDYFEVLVSQDRRSLNVRSQSLIGFYDLGVNRRRVERFRDALIKDGLAVHSIPED